VSVERLELSTNGLKGRCSSIELHARRGTFYHAARDASTDLKTENEADRPSLGTCRGRNGQEVEFVKIGLSIRESVGGIRCTMF
jgi:hypothetical protein